MEFVDPTEDQAAGDEEGNGEADGDGDIDIVPDSDDNVTEPTVQNTDHDLPQTDGEDDNDSDGDEPGEEKESTPITRSTRSGKVAPVQLPPKKRGRGRPKILKSAPGPSGVSTKRTAELKVSNPTSDPTKPTKRICRPSKSATVVTVSSGPSPERPQEPATTPVKVLPTGNGDSDFSITPPPKRESPLPIIRRPQHGKRKAGTASSTVTLTELKALMEGDIGDTTPQAGFSVSTIDESPMKTKSAVLGKKQGKASNVVQEERLSVLQELGSAVKMYKNLLFLIYINDLSHMVNNTSMYLYADDTVLLSTDSCINTCTENMQRDLIIIAKWCQTNKLSLNIKKTKCMLFGSRVRLKRTRQPKLYINNTLVDFVHQYNYLGVILDSHLTFNKHLNNIIKITAHKMNLLSKIRQYLTKFASITIYKTMILPYFDYGDILFINSSKKQLNKLDHLQKRAIKICLKMGQNIPEEMLLRDAKVAKLNDRREAHLLNYMYKKKDCIELLDIKKINTRARAAPLFKTIIPKCEKYKHSVFYYGAIKWNSLPVKIRNIGTYNSFQSLQKKNMLNY